MATTGFWPVKGSLKDVVKYAENPDKTTNPKYLDDDLAAALKYVSNDKMTNQTLRARLGIDDKNYPMASRIIKDTLEAKLIKEENPENGSRRFVGYIPYWA